MPVIGQSYDGASAVMAGHVNGVQKKTRKIHHEQFFFFHREAHKSNLVKIGTSKHITSSVSFSIFWNHYNMFIFLDRLFIIN